jgi:DNA-binding NtrC family response regulator
MNGKTRILLVDDEPQIVRALQRLLRSRRSDWEVRTATSGPAALELLAAEPADIVVSDMRMPGMDGVAFLGAVKETYPQVFRIVLSGQATEDAVERVWAIADTILAKPFDSTMLITTLQQSVDTLAERLTRVHAMTA